MAQLFDDDEATYTVPIYQRNYAWRAEQIEQLIGDVQDALEDGDDDYFLGNLIVTRRPGRTADYEVIDGQQRLTTLYLLLTILAEDGAGPHDAHRDRLRYESRSRATEALRRIGPRPRVTRRHPRTAHRRGRGYPRGLQRDPPVPRPAPAAARREDRGRFADFLRDHVTVVRAALPPKTDLNRYFEIMNTRGQQLHQVDIVKARLMSRLPNETERACFAWIWDACADMDSYVQMSLTRGDPARRRELFGDGWSWLKVEVSTAFSRSIRQRRCHGITDSALGYLNVARRCPGALRGDRRVRPRRRRRQRSLPVDHRVPRLPASRAEGHDSRRGRARRSTRRQATHQALRRSGCRWGSSDEADGSAISASRC